MRCNNCGAEWNVGNSKSVVTKCPFCGESLIQDIQETLEEVTMSSVLQQMVKQFGLDIFSNNSKCLSIFKDLAPELKKEQRWLGIALVNYNIVSYFIDCEEKDRKQHISKAIYAMEADLAETAQKEILTAFVAAFGWDEALLQEYFQGDVKSGEEVKAKQDTENTLPQQKSAISSEDAEMLYQEGEMYYHGHGVEKNFAKAEYYYQKAAEQGHIEAQNSCANMYYNGEGVAQDFSKAAEWYKKAAEQGHAEAQNSLGIMYQNGRGVAQDDAEAVKWYRKAAEQGHADAQCNLGWMYENGRGVAQDDAEAVKWYRKAVEQGNAYAQCNLGWMYENGRGVAQDYAEAVKWYRKAAEQGNAYAQNNLGLMYQNGRGVAQDDAEAVKWYRKAAEQGHADAQNNLGVMYLEGKGVTKNFDNALGWFQKADAQGNMYAPWNIGRMYENGWGVNINLRTAKEWYAKAAERGHTDAKKKLDEIIYSEKIVDAEAQYQEGEKYYNNNDYERAVKWYRKAAEQGYASAQFDLGWMCSNGRGVAQDDAEAVKWYRKAAEQGNARAQCNLGWMYENGRGVAQDDAEAVKWYRKAAEQGNANAQCNLGWMYQNGRGVNINLRTAKEWYAKAAERGHTDAKKKLEELKQKNGESGCFITTAVCGSLNKPDDCDELMTMRRYRDKIKAEDKDMAALIEEYYRVAPLIVKEIDRSSAAKAIYRELWENAISGIYQNVKQKEYGQATLQYMDMLEGLCKQYNIPFTSGVTEIIKMVRMKNNYSKPH